MSLFANIKSNIRQNLDDAGVTAYSQTDIDDATQDAYNEIATLTQCIIKKVTLPFQDNLNYYNFRDSTNFSAIYVNDYIATTAVFNNITNLWLLDDKALKDFDRDRIDWENWSGAAVWWVPCNDAKRIALIPKLTTAGTATFDLYYYAKAPTIQDINQPLLPPDHETLLEFYATADLLEQWEEYSKANFYWQEFWGITEGTQNYDQGIYALAARSKNLAKSDLLMLNQEIE